MFAVVKSGGKQYRVAKDDIITVERLAGEPGATIELTDVLMVGEGASVTLGTPTVAGAMVAAEVVEQDRGPKIIVFRKRRRQNFRRRRGHRQDLTILKVTEILTDGQKPTKKAAKPVVKPEAAAVAEEAPAEAKKAAPEKTSAKKAAPKAQAKKPEAKKAASKKSADDKKPAAKKAPAKKPAAKKTKE
jgi:large subunit ribosomal protein L21